MEFSLELSSMLAFGCVSQSWTSTNSICPATERQARSRLRTPLDLGIGGSASMGTLSMFDLAKLELAGACCEGDGIRLPHNGRTWAAAYYVAVSALRLLGDRRTCRSVQWYRPG